MPRISKTALALGLVLAFGPLCTYANEVPDRDEVPQAPLPPPPLTDLQEVDDGADAPPANTEVRKEALHEAALSFGARGGLARHTWEIMQALRTHAAALDRTFDFSQLLVPVSAGLEMEPPIVSEADDAAVVAEHGQEAAVAQKIYRINQNARIVSTPRNWRAYLERDWGDVTPPPSLLLPQDDDERDEWRRWVLEGWKEGYQQADDIFQADLDRLVHDYTGMVRYRILLAQGIITAPYAAHENRGVTGGGDEMRIGDQAITITGASQLNPKVEKWTPGDH